MSRLVTRASEVRSRSIRWAWAGRLAFGYLAVQTGVEGLGKSAFAAWMIAGLTRGELPGDLDGEPVNVLVVAGEDGIGDTWKPRLDLVGADLDRVGFLNIDKLGPAWNLRDGIDALRLAMNELDARVLFLDAALDHLPPARGGESVNSPTFVRVALAPLRLLMRDLDAVGLFSLHPPKGQRAEFRDLVQASQAFSAIPRVGLYFAYHPDDGDGPRRRRVLIRGKGNIGSDPGALEFRIAARRYQHDDGRVTEREYVTDVRPSPLTMADLAPDKMVGAREPTKTERATAWLRDALGDGEWKPARPLLEALAAQGLGGDSVIKNARRVAGVTTRKSGGVDGGWMWRIQPAGGDGNALTPPASRARPRSDEDAFHPTASDLSDEGKKSRRPDTEPTGANAAKPSPPPTRRAGARSSTPATVVAIREASPDEEARAEALLARYEEAGP